MGNEKFSSKELIQLCEVYGAHNYHPLPVVISKAERVWVWDSEGKKYMDMLSSYSAINQGHRHPKIIDALKKQANNVTLTSRAFHNDQLGPFLKKITEFCQMEMALPMNTGAEAVETALKTARKWGYFKKGIDPNKAEIIVCERNFHGRTITIISFSTEKQYREGFGPFTPGFKIIPYGEINALKNAINENTVAFLVEPIQGEGGIIIPPEGYLREAKSICKENDILFILDEIQTGLGRTGRNFAYEYENAKPDILILGKALGGGVIPISVILSSREVLGVFKPGDHGSTFGGNPLACAVAIASLEVIEEENLAQRAAEMGEYFMGKLKEIDSPKVKEIRGKGLLIGVEIEKEYGKARIYCEKLMELGLLCKETHETVVRFAPPLVISKEEIDWAFERIYKVLS
ncbi:ornithine--oxo-acid transaminase [Candidatus Aminicenantes bacterium AH-873-B07]|jgi:ornithine--oxo-acid transaminase|nr:ornithine--oxo-acid transaminase [Candidatus Aminicenantes bacterium AH-873-B07]